MALAAACLTAVVSLPATAATANSDGLIVSTDTGRLQGKDAESAHQYLGVPYAAAPVGALRWQPPHRAASWSGVRKATENGAACAQAGGYGGTTTTTGSEDCLYLNVYTPRDAQVRHKRLPVLFWIHGGSLKTGSGNGHDGSQIAESQNAVVVSINYRLGVFGFLNVPGLSAGGAGNYGMLDQIAALEWTQRNIASFGGDPGRVTISGESAGAISVCALLASPEAGGLFSKAIMESGVCESITPAVATTRSTAYAKAVGCTDTAALATCLRARSGSDLLAASGSLADSAGTLLPTSGTPELPRDPKTALGSGRFNNVPLLIGFNHDEARLFALGYLGATKATYEQTVRDEYGAHADAVLARYPYDSYPSPYTGTYAVGDVWTDSGYMIGLGGCPAQKLAQDFTGKQARTYFYEFDDQDAPSSLSAAFPGFEAGATHAAEIPYIWAYSGGDEPLSAQFTAAQRKLAKEMTNYWGSFIRTGSPNAHATDQATWPSYRSGRLMSLRPGGSTAIATATYKADHQCGFWNSIA
ncbi:carboxylesterase/lipase family protein [Streptomyces sp. VRA16 Mangrove soil]|uniref:carboxylesterase/lipase family protein n=1 Tax=Streptomyces sp. VRA16 Mangrove soil TaxID=2817434 RepID=UPI001A9F7989|nr:carboxylesterase/lipase family protein [Streptomyces sp. VRA16 Mangrove soil]MBO1330466.1 carboxylesterase family protein [Streptomyces sp. VRA16 Mangrove soil]